MRRDIPDLAEVRRVTQKKRDAWWTVLLVDPVATPLVRLTAKYTRITPNQLTWGAFLLGLVSAAFFALGDWRWLIAGAVVYHLSFILDCMDGKVARLTGQGSVFGAWLDFVFDRVRVAACAVALMAGQYHRTGDTLYIWLAAAVIGFDALRYINSLETFKVRHTMRKQIKARLRAARRAENERELAFMEDLLRENPEADIEQDLERAAAAAVPPAAAEAAQSPVETAPSAPQAQVVDLHQEFRRRFPAYLRVRSFLLRHRIRPHLISGIEFQMGVFMIGPFLDSVLAATIVSGALLLVFELAIIYKLLLSTRDFTRTIDSFDREEAAKVAKAA
ncbi:CDP-alcohol phosphatidyltransferase family protein [Streptomyces ipomoeae]|jgi:phosphatidylglycerophosphate synthase|uniref:CDP-alcohol phosphatidyltransferase n=2 Tax=Streptomyces ipomoeae TaxID=103232 RepID=L1L314_9ACTN|nr:CDP-alcohol phosphatidyltransferase family protein [Streptomyces ipomoeae]EKX67095.1 CDP-alcohol phosphatidyltransferase [Streptomyces ipomoeae 91-03]MDX2697948.1 CDP-alcohol phosphatidyltransferase family protein [Streptomyces ipomoeae]MDX2824600.1 CDP-alcohol phosphatidyltransferase family protein [Streptomyces ipomoeae]MDX2842280.1 CDP-alcohol phosphatidyltransferase family protein [Streptomyces ipomoeae]MDX2878005.1 CDP-alcohol phosphatidyltransferase family protein [Streptomyces ipomoe